MRRVVKISFFLASAVLLGHCAEGFLVSPSARRPSTVPSLNKQRLTTDSFGRPKAWHVCSTTLEEDQLNEFRELRANYEDAQRKKEEEEQQMERDAATQATGPVSVLRQATESQGYLVAEGAVVALAAVLVHAAWSGLWSDYGLITYATQQQLQAATLSVAAAHVTLALLSAFMTHTKERALSDTLSNAARTLLVGGLDFVRVALMDDRSEDEIRTLSLLPPLSMEISTFQMAATQAPDAVLLSTTIRTLPGKEVAMRKLLTQLVDSAMEAPTSSLLFTMAVNQDPQDRRNFNMLQRFASLGAMSKYQASTPFKTFTRESETLLSDPFGLYITNERKGKLTSPNYPFGPGGEGGRDDAVFSSPTNLDGSQSGVNRN